MLNVLLWVDLLISIPFAGFRPIYVTMALIGVFVLALVGAIVFALMRGETQAERVIYWIARHVKFVNGDKLVALFRRLAQRLRDVVDDPALLRRLAFWALLNWLLDAAALWVFIRAFGTSARVDFLIVAFCVANISASIPITPGGLGVLDATLVATLALFGYGNVAGIAVPLYRLAQYWLPIPLGALSYVSLRAGPWSIDRERELRRLRDETHDYVRRGESVYEWADRHGHRSDEPPTLEMRAVESPPESGSDQKEKPTEKPTEEPNAERKEKQKDQQR
jgi:hypothetical protein